MIDPRLEKLAQVLVKYSLELKKGDLFAISGHSLAAPLIKEVYRQAVSLGAHPFVRVGIDGLAELFYKMASEEQLTYVSPLEKFELEHIDARLAILCPVNTRSMTNVDPKKQALTSTAHQELHDLFLQRAAKKELRWCLTQYPTQAAAQDADMSLEEYEEFVFAAAHVTSSDPLQYWKSLHHEQQRIVDLLSGKKNLRIVAEDTDLSLSVAGRAWINCDGKENFPDGEVFTGPIETSAEGTIRYSYPGVYGGRLVEDIRLSFEKGKVVKAEASTGRDFLLAMLDMDEGSRRLGEVAFGMNYGIQQFSKNTLFDEKIGGTMHLALGSGYPETGSTNKSSLHWDMVCDLRSQGEVYADDELIYRQGKFIL